MQSIKFTVYFIEKKQGGHSAQQSESFTRRCYDPREERELDVDTLRQHRAQLQTEASMFFNARRAFQHKPEAEIQHIGIQLIIDISR